MTKLFNFLVVSLLIGTSIACKEKSVDAKHDTPKSEITHDISYLKDKLINPDNDQVTVVVHRGDWRNAPENSLLAIENAIKMGADMVELDVRKTKDGKLILMHDTTIDRTTMGEGKVAEWTLDSLKTLYLKNGAGNPTKRRIPTLEEAMLTAKGKILVNLDKSYSIFDDVYQILKETKTVDQVVMKGSVEVEQVKEEFGHYLDKVIFMPIVNVTKPNASEIIKNYNEQMHPIAYELVFVKVDSTVYKDFQYIKENKSKLWVNSLWASLNGGYDDDKALINKDSIYGWFLKNKVDIIQTDRPELLLKYLRSKNMHR